MAKSALIDDLERQFAENPRRVFARLANEYRKAGELETAIEICRAHVPLQPTYISGYIVLGQALFESGQLEEARSTFETALGLDPENLIALRQLGDIARAGGDAAGAHVWYRRLLEVDPQNDEVVALVEELSAQERLTAAAAPPAAAPITWGDINPEQLTAAAPPPPSAVASPATAEPPPPAPQAPAPVASAPAGPVSTAPEHSIGTLDLTDLQFVGVEPPAPPAPPPAPQPPLPEAPPATQGFDFESLSSFGIDSFTAGHADVSGIERADELFSPDANNAGQPIPGLELEGLERSGYFVEPPPSPPAPEPAATSPPAQFRQAGNETGGGPGDEPGVLALFGEPAAEAIPEPPVEEFSVESLLMGEPAAEPAAESAPPAFVTETMAELYLRQGHRDAALEIYRQLVAQRPTDSALRARVAQLEQPEKRGAPERTVRAFFARLALKQPPVAGMPLVPPVPPPAPSAAPEPVVPGAAAPLAVAPEPEAPAPPAAEAPEVEPDGAPATAESAPASAEAARHQVELSAVELPEPEVAATRAAVPETPPAQGPTLEPPVEERPVAELLFGELEPLPRVEAPPGAEGVASATGAAPEAASVDETELAVESLFGSGSASPDDELAAATLAGAFAPEMGPADRTGPVGGLPARAASDPLSLDTVFREGRGGGERRPQSNVSFDEFFSGEEGGTSGARAGDETQPSADANPDRDLELFQAWLEGLKK